MKALVTGGGGFLGRAITEQLLARGDTVTILARGRYPQVEALGATAVQADLREPASLQGVLAGADVVFHVASKTGVWGPRDEFMGINVDGTRNLLAAARAAGVARFVYTSSPSCVHSGGDEEGLTEADCPYPDHFETDYPESKALAEQLVLAANADRFATTSLRPHLIYGPGEPHMLPRLIDRHGKGRLRRIGDGNNRVGLTYIDNAAVAHLQAADALSPGSDNAGKAYFVTDGGSVLLWQWIDHFMTGIGMPPLPGGVSLGVVKLAAGVMEFAWRGLGLPGEPLMTRFAATQLATSHWYDLSAAQQDFGYSPLVDGDEGLARTIAAFSAASSAAREG